jgi:hypothetical protein
MLDAMPSPMPVGADRDESVSGRSGRVNRRVNRARRARRALHCRIEPFLDQGGPLRGPRAGTSAGLRPLEAPADACRPKALSRH